MRRVLCTGAVVLASALIFAQGKPMPPLTVVPSIDIQRYAGTWFEIARLPNSFQKQCAGDVTATYTIDGNELMVVNRCRKENGETTEATGRARRDDDNEPNSKLKVRFAPAFLSFLPFVWGDYWVIDLSPDYTYAVVGEPNRQYLWILSRTPALPDSTMQGILGRIRQQGYDLSDLVHTMHTPKSQP